MVQMYSSGLGSSTHAPVPSTHSEAEEIQVLSIDHVKLTPENGHLLNLPTWQVIRTSNIVLCPGLAGNIEIIPRIPASFSNKDSFCQSSY